MKLKWVEYLQNTPTEFSGNGECLYEYILGTVKVGEVGWSWYYMKVTPDDKYQAMVHLPGVNLEYQLYSSIEAAKEIVEDEVKFWIEGTGLK
jgi:hypothetical protein